MNIEDYEPSRPVEDRRGETYYGRQRRWPMQLMERPARSLLDLQYPSWYGDMNVRGGLSRDLGYNMIGQDPRMDWRNRLPLPAMPTQNYPTRVQPSYYEPQTVGWQQPWTMGR